MLYILWYILNIVLFVLFIVYGFRATKFIREKLGLLAAIFFVLALVSFIRLPGNQTNKEPGKNEIKKWHFTAADSISISSTHPIHVALEETSIATYNLGIVYGTDTGKSISVPLSAYSFLTGMIGGTNWKPLHIDINTTADTNKFQYNVNGVIEWTLLGLPVYSQTKTYKGIATATHTGR